MISRLEITAESDVLCRNRLFAGIPSSLLGDIGSDVRLLHLEAENVIFQEGEAADCLFLVIEGSVRISKVGRGGSQETLGFIQPGNFFGETALIDGQPRSAQATAAERTVLGRIDASSFESILENAPRGLHMNLLRTVVERLREINSHFITELMRGERLALVGSMSNNIIHDLRNPIHAIQSCAHLIRMRSVDPDIIEFTDIVEKSADRMTDMVQELLDFARGETSLQMQRHPARAIMDELDSQLVRLLPVNVHLLRDIHFCDEVSVDLGRFVRVLLNLTRNSIEAMDKGGVLRVGLRQRGDHAIFRVCDTGCGIPPEIQVKLFEPFVTHGESHGTGLGLAIAKSVVEGHGGGIALRSKPGIGTTIEISLPTLPQSIVA